MPVIKVKSKEVKIKVPLTALRIEPTTQSKTVEPSIEEQIKMATDELERKNQDLAMAIYNKEHEIEILKQQLQKQEEYYNNAIARLVLATYGG